ncbi:hypothetical protein HNP33_000994 [Comamonas odontotermitis]|uniref:Uncharacterized protein n=1 Tax=Comamonas odontotermitis TaxID=379895 RepID=A0ABR6RCT2_9BURK|nr:hypothetical protein [Comamonas odontotermitis]MBB6576944.1 hypothetical protein [Comamonas odontotermitis]
MGNAPESRLLLGNANNLDTRHYLSQPASVHGESAPLATKNACCIPVPIGTGRPCHYLGVSIAIALAVLAPTFISWCDASRPGSLPLV